MNQEELTHNIIPARRVALTNGVAVDLTDPAGANLKPYARRLWVGTAGTLTAKWQGESVAVLQKAVSAGTYVDGPFISVDLSVIGSCADVIAEQ